jgi:hypothetical protein
VKIRSKVIPVMLAGAPVARIPRSSEARDGGETVLPLHSATLIDCCRLSEHVLGALGSGAPLHIGFLEITSSAEVAVTAVYTVSGPTAGAVSVDVKTVKARRI